MPITQAEAARLQRRTGMAQDDFAVDNDGVLTLLNNAETRALRFSPDRFGRCSSRGAVFGLRDSTKRMPDLSLCPRYEG